MDEIADLLELKGESRYRVGAYRTAARRIGIFRITLGYLAIGASRGRCPASGVDRRQSRELLATGKSGYLESLRKEVSPGLRELLKVPGLGPARSQIIHRNLGITTIPQLEEAARQHRLRQLPGIREKTEEKILREVERLQQRSRRLLLGVALPAAEEVVRLMEANPLVRRIQPAGSLRRMQETIGDIDILVSSEKPAEVTKLFAKLPIVKEVLAVGPTKASVLTRDNLQIDLRAVKPGSTAALQYFTGDKSHNIALRNIAISKGYKLSEYGLFDERTGKRLASEEEADIYHCLGLEWMPLRSGRTGASLRRRLNMHCPT